MICNCVRSGSTTWAARELIATAADEACVALIERWCGERQSRRPEPAASAGGSADGSTSSGAWSNAEIDRQVRGRIAMMALSADDVMLGMQQVAERIFGAMLTVTCAMS